MTTLTTVEDLFKTVVWDNAVTSVLISAGINVWPVTAIVFLFTNKIYDALRVAVNIEVAILKDAAAKKAFDDASVRLKIIAIDYGVDSDKYKTAREDAKKALLAFVAF